MQKHFFLLILMTFVVGFACGVYGFFISRDTKSNVDTAIVEETGYEILVTTYGGCERIGCVSLRLLDDGSYTYLAPEGIRDYARYEDVISPRQLESLTNLTESASLDEFSETVFTDTCPVTYDGIAYRFDIRRDGDRFSFDSCVESTHGGPLFDELVSFIAIMEATHRVP